MRTSALDKAIARQENLIPLTREKIAAYTLERLNETFERCRRRSDFYAYLPEKITTLDEMAAIPTMDGRILSEHNRALLLLSQGEVSRVVSDETSGTTGGAKRLFFTAADQERTVDFFAAGLSEMVGPGDRTLICMPSTTPGSLADLISGAITKLKAKPTIFGIGRSFSEMYDVWQAERINTVVAMPVPLLSFHRWVQAQGIELKAEGVLLGADAASVEIQELLTVSFGCPPFPHYGSREMGLEGAVTCAAHAGQHIAEQDLYLEILDEGGVPLPDGEPGEIAFTTLCREAMPLIRYRTGDRGRIIPEPCPCGSIIRRLGDIHRPTDAPVAMDRLDALVFAKEKVMDYRASLRDGELFLEVVAIGELSVSKLQAGLEERLGLPVRISLIEADFEAAAPLYLAKRFL